MSKIDKATERLAVALMERLNYPNAIHMNRLMDAGVALLPPSNPALIDFGRLTGGSQMVPPTHLGEVEITLRYWLGLSKFLPAHRVHIARKGSQVEVVIRLNPYRFAITASASYLGCIATERGTGKGNDLSDGEFNLMTWSSILADIIGYSMKEEHDKQDTCDVCGCKTDKLTLINDYDFACEACYPKE